MAKNDNVEFGKFRKNIMGTLSFEMKLPNMRKAQDFIVYPVNEKTNYITIQSDTRFGKIEMTTGRGLMSQSHANGAYAVHLHIDKLVKFELTESQLEKLKEELVKTAGRNVGSAGVVSDNEYADKFAKGGGFDQYGNPMGFERDYDTEYEIHHKPEMNSKTPYMIWDKMDGVYVGAYQSRQRAIEWIESNSYYAKGGYMAAGGELGEIKVGSKIGFLRPHTGRYEYADVLSIDGENVNLVIKHPKKRQWDNYFTETKSRISEFTNTESEDWKDGRPLMKIKYAAGGELVDKTIDHSGRYLDIVGNHRMLHIHLNDEGREMVMEERENGRGDEEIMYELFEDVAGNSDLMYHTDLGESGFGMTDASGVTAGYMYGDDGELEPADDTAVVYVDNDSYRRSPVEELLETHLVLKNSDFMAKGGMTFGGKMAGAGIFSDGGLADDNIMLFDSLKKGDTIKITFKDSISGSDEATLKVKSKTIVNKGKATQSEKINFINTENPHGVGWYAYKRQNGFVGFAWGDMAIWDVRVIERFADGGVLGKEENYERRLKFINEDIKRVLENSPEEYLNIPVKDYERIAILLHNIEIASDIYDDESDNWTFAKGGHIGKNLKVKDWYMKNYPTDDLGNEINDAISFKDLWAYMSQGYDVYEVLGVGDSLVRERVFEKLSEVYGVGYDAVYKMWLNTSSNYAEGGHMGKKTIEKVTLIFDGKEHKYDMVFIDGEFEEVLLPYTMNTPLFDYLEREFDDWMDSASRDYHDMYFSDEAIYSKRGAIQGAIEIIDDTISEDRGKKKVYNLDKGEVDTMAAYS